MARTDFTYIISNIVLSLDNLESKLRKISPILGQFGKEAATSLNTLNSSIGTGGLGKSANELEKILGLLVSIKNNSKFEVGKDILGERSFKSTSTQLSTIINKIIVMRDSLQLLNTIQQKSSKVGLRGAYPYTERSLRNYYPELLDPDRNKNYSVFGSYSTGSQRIGMGAQYGAYLGPLETVLHEIGHHVLNTFEKLGGDLNTILDKYPKSLVNVEETLYGKFKVAGLPDAPARDAAKQQAKRTLNNYREGFADEFSSLALTGETVFPQMKNVINDVVDSLGKKTAEELRNLQKELITQYTEQVNKDLQAGLPESFTELRAKATTTKIPRRVNLGWEEEISQQELQDLGIQTLSSTSPSLEDLGTTAENSTKRVEDLRIAIRNLFKEYVRGTKTPTEEGIEKVLTKVERGDIISERQRIGGGAYLSSSREFKAKLDALKGELIQELDALKQIQLVRQDVERRIPTEQPIQRGADTEDALNKLRAATAEGAKITNAKLVERGFQAFPGLGEDKVKALTEAVNPLLNSLNNLGVVLEDVSVKYKIAENGAILFNIGLKDTKKNVTTANLVLSEQGEVLSKLQYSKLKVPTTIEGALGKFKGLDKGVIAGIDAEAKPLLETFTRLGLTVEQTSAKYRILEDGTIRFTVAVKDNSGAINQLNAYLTKEGQILGEVAYKQKQVSDASYTQAGLVSSLGETRARRALELAKKYEFTLEHLKSVTTQAPSGVSFLNFQAVDAEGVSQRLQVTVDRFGTVIGQTNKRLLDFSHSVVRNIQELLRWSIGIGLVYGTWYKLQELIRLSIDNQAKLVDVTVALGDSQRELYEIFDDASKIAVQTGENINGVLESYTLAYRAVGGIEEPIRRTAVANQLLTDSTILAKLSALNAAEAIDVLSGSLRQLQKPGEDLGEAFARGTDLLDMWVAVSRKANVDLSTLATAFSITSESAENSGVSIEELNAIIASLSEKIGGLGGRETGNAVRALIGGVYQQQASEALARYGIAIQDTTGRMRPFLEISRDIYEMYSQGLINADELNKLGYVLGGGVRRGQQYVAFLSDFARIQEIVALQTGATGSAQEALGRKLDTVQTSIVNLGNAFLSLSNTLGDKGGILSTLDGVLKVSTFLVNSFEQLSRILGKMTVPATILALASYYFRGSVGQAKFGNLQSTIGSAFAGGISNILGVVPFMQQPIGTAQVATPQHLLRQGVPQYGQQVTRAQQIGLAAGSYVGRYAPGIALGALPALARISEEPNKVGLAKAGVIIGASVIGAIATGGSPIGAVIGGAIAEATISGLENSKGQIEDLFLDLYPVPNRSITKGIGKEGDLTYQKALENADKALEEFSSTFTGEIHALITKIDYFFYQYLSNIPGATAPRESRFAVPPLPEGGEFTAYTERKREAQRAVEDYERSLRGETTFTVISKERYEAAKRVLELAAKAESLQYEEIPEEVSKIGYLQAQLANKYEDYLEGVSKTLQEELRAQSIKREIKPKQFKESLETAQALPETSTKLYTALYESFQGLEDPIEGAEQTLNDFSETLLYATAEDRYALNQLSSGIFDIERALEGLEGKAPEALAPLGEESLNRQQLLDLEKQKVIDLRDVYLAVFNEIKSQQAAKIEIPQVISLEGYDPTEMELILSKTRELQEAYFKEAIDEGFLNEEQMQQKIKDAEPLFLYLGQILGYYLKEGITDTGLFKQAEDLLSEAGKIAKEEPAEPLSYQFLNDVTQAQFNAILPQYEAIRQAILAKGGESEEDPLLTFFKDSNSPVLMEKDWKIVQYLLQQILDVNQKQLDGLYNLPSEATFYVPSQTLKLAYQAGLNAAAGAGGGLAGIIGTPEEKKPDLARYEFPNIPLEPGRKEARYEFPEIRKPETLFDNVERLKREYEIPEPGIKAPEELKNIFPTDIFSAEIPRQTSILDQILQIIRTAIPFIRGEEPIIKPGGVIIPDNLKGILSNTSAGGKDVSTNLKLDVTSNVQLLIDGRMVANIVKQYLWEDLIRYDQTAGATTRQVII